MRINSIKLIPIKLHLKEPFIIASVTNDEMFYVIVKVTTDNGLVGYGEAIPAWEVTGETQFSVIDVINHLCEPQKTGMSLIGQDISSLEQIENLFSLIAGWHSTAIIAGAPSARAALQGAVLDAFGKYVKKPIYEFFNGKKRPILVNRVISIFPVQQTLERVRDEIKRSSKTIKLKIGIKDFDSMNNFERDVKVVREAKKLIDATDSGIKLVADANQGFVDEEQAIAFCKRVEGCLDWLEQPILAENKRGFKKIKESCSIKLMADESVHSFYDAKLLIDAKAVDYINLKIMKCGGLFEVLRIAEYAAENNVPCQIGSMLDGLIGCAFSAQTHLSHANIFSAEIATFSRLTEKLGKGIELAGNEIKLSNKPGLGVEIDDKDIESYRIMHEDSLTYRSLLSER
ncbi:MAG: enolase C-terminal domain-like protein [Nanoarchaeota archaeon]